MALKVCSRCGKAKPERDFRPKRAQCRVCDHLRRTGYRPVTYPRLPIEPLRRYLRERLRHYDSANDMAAAMGLPERTIRRFFEPHTREVQIDTVDQMLTKEGLTMLEELYPLEEYPTEPTREPRHKDEAA